MYIRSLPTMPRSLMTDYVGWDMAVSCHGSLQCGQTLFAAVASANLGKYFVTLRAKSGSGSKYVV